MNHGKSILKHRGKVRDVYDEGSSLLRIVCTDRLSAFNRNICEVERKGFYLNKQAEFWFKKTSKIIENHMILSYDDNMVVWECQPFKIEVVVRSYITGSLWRAYEKGERNLYGISFPDGLKRNQKLKKVIITPTEKSETDDPITDEKIIEKGLASKEEWDFIKLKALELFDFASKLLKEKGFILVDTKLEFGRRNGRILLIDECFTTDSSRIWTIESYLNDPENPENFDKDIVRNKLLEGGECDQKTKDELIRRYSKFNKILYGVK